MKKRYRSACRHDTDLRALSPLGSSGACRGASVQMAMNASALQTSGVTTAGGIHPL
jgi:hypothetical protein